MKRQTPRTRFVEPPLRFAIQMIQDNNQDNRPDHHPDGPKQPEKQQNGKVITTHAHSIMQHAPVQNSGDVFRSDFVGQGGGDVDHKIDVVEITDRHAKAKENKEEIDNQHHQFEQP